jgi:hypothetical protein
MLVIGRLFAVIDNDVSTAYGLTKQIQLMPLNLLIDNSQKGI